MGGRPVFVCPSGCCDGGSGATDIYFPVRRLQAQAQAQAELVSARLPGLQTASLGTRAQGLPGASFSGADPVTGSTLTPQSPPKGPPPTTSLPGAQPNQLGVRIQHGFGRTHQQTVACPLCPGPVGRTLLTEWMVTSRVTPCLELGLPGRTSPTEGPGPASPSTCLIWVCPARTVSRLHAHPACPGGGDHGSHPTLSLSRAGGSSCSNSCSKCWREI